MGIEKPQIKPAMFELTTNYRSHSGIVNCAQAVIDLIIRFWPNTIDTLQPQCSVIQGLKPICLSGGNLSFSSEQFFAGLAYVSLHVLIPDGTETWKAAVNSVLNNVCLFQILIPNTIYMMLLQEFL